MPRPKQEKRPIGLAALLGEAGSLVPKPAVVHYAGGGSREVLQRGARTEITIPGHVAPSSVAEHFRFAIRREALDLGAWAVIMHSVGRKLVEDWVSEEPFGKHARRAWCLFEILTRERLPFDDSVATKYEDLADASLQLCVPGQKMKRYKLRNNLLGPVSFCPLVRRTERLQRLMDSDLRERARLAVAGIEPRDIERAVEYLYRKETKASFEIEHVVHPRTYMERFVSALRTASTTSWYDEKALVDLQSAIVDPRFAERKYRTIQVYVGQTLPWGQERVHYACPRPEDVGSLMTGWRDVLFRTSKGLHPVCQAAVLGFGFVLIHPFEDGNGRIHRFVIHATLVRREFTPEGVVIPVSATMLRKREAYDEVLEAFSEQIMPLVNYRLDEDGHMEVTNDTANLYRYWDATQQCEYLFEALAEAVAVDLPEELQMLRAFDAGRVALRNVIDLPDRRADRLIALLLQNGFSLSKRKRALYSELTDDEVAEIESAVRAAAEQFIGERTGGEPMEE